MKILVTGATGFVGHEVLRQLHAAGHEARILVRDTKVAAGQLPHPNSVTQFHRGDVTELRSLTGAAKGCDAVIHLVGIISEFGAELKDFNIELVVKLGGTLNKKQLKDHEKQQGDGETEAPQSFVIPGDITIVYDIAEDGFLCHEDGQVHGSDELECISHDTYDVSGQHRALAPDVQRNDTIRRAHLCLKDTQDGTRDAGIVEYYCKLFARRMPHLKPPD